MSTQGYKLINNNNNINITFNFEYIVYVRHFGAHIFISHIKWLFSQLNHQATQLEAQLTPPHSSHWIAPL